jgi:hypothetical protein
MLVELGSATKLCGSGLGGPPAVVRALDDALALVLNGLDLSPSHESKYSEVLRDEGVVHDNLARGAGEHDAARV